MEPGGYTRVSVDRERKDELLMAKAVRRSSAKMLGRSCSPMSVSPGDSPVTVMEATPPPQVQGGACRNKPQLVVPGKPATSESSGDEILEAVLLHRRLWILWGGGAGC